MSRLGSEHTLCCCAVAAPLPFGPRRRSERMLSSFVSSFSALGAHRSSKRTLELRCTTFATPLPFVRRVSERTLSSFVSAFSAFGSRRGCGSAT